MRLIVTACTGHMGAIVCDLIEQGFENHTLAAKTSRQCEENGVDRCYRTVTTLTEKPTASWIFPITKPLARFLITVSAAICPQ